jgi:hypothetical protein
MLKFVILSATACENTLDVYFNMPNEFTKYSFSSYAYLIRCKWYCSSANGQGAKISKETFSTKASHVVTHRTTGLARTSLTSEIERDRVHFG